MEKLPMTAERCSCRFGPSDEPLGVCAYHQEWAKRIAELEAERADLRQRLIGAVACVNAGRDLTKWAEANAKYLWNA